MNQLQNEKSPYLRQHRNNPVNWYPWKPEAFERAEKEDKPIFLSIGYSTCHWCHIRDIISRGWWIFYSRSQHYGKMTEKKY